MTLYGRRWAREARPVPTADVRSTEPVVFPGAAQRTPRWVYIVGFHAIGVALLLVVLHLTMGPAWTHKGSKSMPLRDQLDVAKRRPGAIVTAIVALRRRRGDGPGRAGDWQRA